MRGICVLFLIRNGSLQNYFNFPKVVFAKVAIYGVQVKLYLQDKTHEEQPDEGVVLHQNIGRYNRMTQQCLTIVIILRYLVNNKDINSRSVAPQELCQKVYKIPCIVLSVLVHVNYNTYT
jgi:hypothetical protein